MLLSLAFLVACQAAGEVVHKLLGLPVPGAVLGIGLLLFSLCMATKRGRPSPILPAADTLLSYLPLFFVPPGVSTVMQIGRLAHIWPAVLIGLVGSSILALIVTGRVMQALLARCDTTAVDAAP